MSDPRERIETAHIRCDNRTDTAWCLGAVGSDVAAWATWPELVELAQKILAANEAWLDANTPTLEELRARWPRAMVAITPLHIPGDDYLARLVIESGSVEYAGPTVGHVLRWLAAKLEELGDGK